MCASSNLAALRQMCNIAAVSADPAQTSACGHRHRHGTGNHRHNHHHHHGHHHHGGSAHGFAFAVAVALNGGFVVAEAVAGWLSGSMALIADAGHNLSDVLSLVLAWVASAMGTRPPSERLTWGYKSSTILAALANAVLLALATGAILAETLRRFAAPAPVEGWTMVMVAAAGIAVNGLSAMMFMRGAKGDLNLRAAFQHLMADALVSLGVVVAGALVLLTGKAWIDPATSLVICLVIGWGCWGLLRDSLHLGLLGVPAGIDTRVVGAFLRAQPGVAALHDLHVWPVSTTETALTVHLVMPDGHPGDAALHRLAEDLRARFAIGHPTIQIETTSGADCALEPDGVV